MTPEWVEAQLDRWFGVGEPDDLTAATRTKIKRDGPRSIHRPVPALDQRAARTPSKEIRMPLPSHAQARLDRLTGKQPVAAAARTLDVGEARRARAAAERPLDVGAVRAARAAAAKPPKAAPAPAPKPKPRRRGVPLGATKSTYRVEGTSFDTYVRVPATFGARWHESAEDVAFALRAFSVEVRQMPGAPHADVDVNGGRLFVRIDVNSEADAAVQETQLRRGLAEAAFRATHRGPWTAAVRDACRTFADQIAASKPGGPVGGNILVARAYDAARGAR